MNTKQIQYLSRKVGISSNQTLNTVKLLADGATVPFIARYRKERTGGLEDIQVRNLKMVYEKLLELEKRKLHIIKTIDELGVLNGELQTRIKESFDLAEIEDLYLPFKKKRQTKAEVARKKGLEPLAKMIMSQKDRNIANRVPSFVKGVVQSEAQAVQGAKDIIAEWINESVVARDTIRRVFERNALLTAKVVKSKQADGEKFKDYFNYSERLDRCKSHRLLAIRRGESEGILKVTLRPDEALSLQKLERIFVKQDPMGWVCEAVKESYKRLLAPSIENEFANASKEEADKEAIKVFAENLEQLLLAAPLGTKRVLSIDPGFRTGCKVVCLDESGDLLFNTAIYPHSPQNQRPQSIEKLKELVAKYSIQAIAIGNATAGRETEQLVRSISFDRKVEIFVVSESGASVYSASDVAREEFPDHDVTVRGSVSIGRRLMDPLAELVKIDPKSIGVGQYQHDVDQKMLQQTLDAVVESCVNRVGVDVNSASKHLLSYVSGLGPQLASNIIQYRKENGAFASRAALKSVPRMGEKAFEQCAGFLRIKDGQNPLDNSSVHPESYFLVEEIAAKSNCQPKDLIRNQFVLQNIDWKTFQSDRIGMATLSDIKAELLKPSLDPRQKATQFEFAAGIHSIEDLTEGMVIPGIVTNITNFGAFVDVGVKQDGLVHISNIANAYISAPSEVLKLQQQVQVKVIEVDVKRKRIGLSIKDA